MTTWTTVNLPIEEMWEIEAYRREHGLRSRAEAVVSLKNYYKNIKGIKVRDEDRLVVKASKRSGTNSSGGSFTPPPSGSASASAAGTS